MERFFNIISGITKRLGLDKYNPFGEKPIVSPVVTPTPTPMPTPQPSPTPTATPTPSPLPTPSPTPTPMMAQYAGGRDPRTLAADPGQDVINSIEAAAAAYGIPASLLYDIGFGESSLNPGSMGPGDTVDSRGLQVDPRGLFQFTTPTWQSVQKYENNGGSIDLPSLDRMDPYAAATAAAYLISHGQLGRWTASEPSWGQYYSDEELSPYYSQTPSRR